MNILVVIRWPVGGIRTFLRYVYTQFDPTRDTFTIIAPNLAEMPVLLNDLKGFEVKYIQVSKDVSVKELIHATLKATAIDRYDLIHSQGLTAGISCIFPSLRSRIPHLMTAHDTFNKTQFRGITGFAKRVLFIVSLPFIDRIHCVSEDAKNNFLRFIPTLSLLKREPVAISNAINVLQFQKKEQIDLREQLVLEEDTFLIGFFGRFMSPKGFIYLLEALQKLKTKEGELPKKPVVLTYGEGAFIREEKTKAKEMGVDDRIYFNSFTPNIAPVLKGLDVVVMPSLWEACPLLPMEAMVSGIPFIGSTCRGLREVMKGTPAIKVPPGDSVAIYNALVKEMANPSTQKFAKFVTSAAVRFDVKKQALKVQQVIDELIRK